MQPMRRTPVVLGILNIIFGSLVACWALFGLLVQNSVKEMTATFTKLMAMAPHRPGTPDPAAMMESMVKALEKLKPYQYAMSGGFLLLSLACIGVGYGLWKRQAWSRQAAVLWSIAALAFIPVQLWLQVGVVLPMTNEIMMESFKSAGMPTTMFEAMQGMQGAVTVVMGILFWAPYPIILAILMGRSSAKNDLDPV
jgi:hypothetical protein